MDHPEKLVWTVREESQDHEDQQELTESLDLRDHPDPEEPQDQLWSSTCHLDQNLWHQRDHLGDQLSTNTNNTNTTPLLRTRKTKPRNRWICSTSSMDLRSPCSERPSLMEVQNIQLNHAEKFKCASPKPRQE